MDILPIILLMYLISGGVIGIFCSYLADQKGHSGSAWFVLGFLFSFLALLVLIGLPSEERPPQEQGGGLVQSAGSPVGAGSAPRQPRSIRLCPHCIQEVHELATACPHCQRSLPDLERCSYEPCGKIINPTDDRCEDDEGNPFCQESHMRCQSDQRIREPPKPLQVQEHPSSPAFFFPVVVSVVVVVLVLVAALAGLFGG